MIVTIKYGSRPGEKLIEKGNFICPLCSRKRQYKRFKVVKENFFGIISIPTKEIGEYVLCQSCFKAFPPKVLDAGLQLKMKIEEGPLPPANLMNIWQDTYTALDCDDLITNKFTAIGVISPILFTMAKHMQEVGVKFRLEDYEEARRYLLTTINLGLEWLETNSKYNLKLQTKTPKQHQRILEFMDCTSVLLSRLP